MPWWLLEHGVGAVWRVWCGWAVESKIWRLLYSGKQRYVTISSCRMWMWSLWLMLLFSFHRQYSIVCFNSKEKIASSVYTRKCDRIWIAAVSWVLDHQLLSGTQVDKKSSLLLKPSYLGNTLYIGILVAPVAICFVTLFGFVCILWYRYLPVGMMHLFVPVSRIQISTATASYDRITFQLRMKATDTSQSNY